jgi:NTE family protein
MTASRRTIGIALGTGAARGWAHIGVIKELVAMGIEADVICGTSIGALVGAAYANGRLEDLESWILGLDRKKVLRHVDINLLIGGGFVEGKRLIHDLRTVIGDPPIEDLPRTFGAVSCDLATGNEIWFKKGSLMDAVHASIAVPGVFVPVYLKDKWLVDGGLVNPVPVSLCRSMGANVVIAVNLNGERVGRNLHHRSKSEKKSRETGTESSLLEKLAAELKQKANALLPGNSGKDIPSPGIFEVLAASLNIMQDRITRSRMAGDPPDLVIAPRTNHVGLLHFERARNAIDEGRVCVRRLSPVLQDLFETAYHE